MEEEHTFALYAKYMQINKLHLKDFRNHEDKTIEFDSKINIIIGNNGIGKTNILEAIHLLATTKSLRTNYDREMIAHGKATSAITSKVIVDDEEKKLELILVKSELFQNSSSKRAKANGTKKSLQEFSGILNSVLFSPSDIEVFAGTPSNRRKYLDSIFFQFDINYKRAFADYTKAVKQRNTLLETIRETGKGKDLIEFWDEKIITTGIVIQDKRSDFFDFINTEITKHSELVNGKDADVYVKYNKSLVSKERINEYKYKEIGAARTLIGPHKDDFSIQLNGYPIDSFGSRGQQRSTLLALKLCEIDYLTQQTKKRPLLLLDDIFSELDDYHKEAVWNIMELQQTIVTSTEEYNLTPKVYRKILL